MNRVFLCGIALFFAIVAIALLGGQEQAAAGHGCGGCHGVVACDGADAGCAATCRGRCFGRLRQARRCGGSRGRLFAKRRCAGRVNDCCGTQEVVADCCSTAVASDAAPTEAEVHEAPPAVEPGGVAPAP